MSEQMHTYECHKCEHNLISHDAEALADEAARHEDYHAYADEFAAKTGNADEAHETVTATCVHRTCDETFTGTPEDASEWYYQHSHQHKAMADTLKIETLAGFNIVDETLADEGRGGIAGALELLTDHGMFGEPTTRRHYISISKARGANNDPGIPAELLPVLISELQRLHSIHTRHITPS